MKNFLTLARMITLDHTQHFFMASQQHHLLSKLKPIIRPSEWVKCLWFSWELFKSLEDGTEEYYWNNAEAAVHPIYFNESISVTVVHENLTFIWDFLECNAVVVIFKTYGLMKNATLWEVLVMVLVDILKNV